MKFFCALVVRTDGMASWMRIIPAENVSKRSGAPYAQMNGPPKAARRGGGERGVPSGRTSCSGGLRGG